MRRSYQAIKSILLRKFSWTWIITAIIVTVFIGFSYKLHNLHSHVYHDVSNRFNFIFRQDYFNSGICPTHSIEDADNQTNNYGKRVTAPRHLIFNSVPKSGSRSLVSVMWALATKHGAPEPHYIDYMLGTNTNTETKTATLISHLVSLKHPSFIHGHIPYLELPNEVVPVFASVLREPYARYVSWYYFMRYGDGDMNETNLISRLGPDAARQNETLDDCFRLERSDCQNWKYYRLNIMMFCGHDPRCNYDPDFALAKAKRNVDNYLVIGITEEFDDSVIALELLMPSMFRGAFKQYIKIKDELLHTLHTPFKKEPSPAHKAIMMKKLRHDIELYEYVKERFHKLKKRLGIGGDKSC